MQIATHHLWCGVEAGLAYDLKDAAVRVIGDARVHLQRLFQLCAHPERRVERSRWTLRYVRHLRTARSRVARARR